MSLFAGDLARRPTDLLRHPSDDGGYSSRRPSERTRTRSASVTPMTPDFMNISPGGRSPGDVSPASGRIASTPMLPAETPTKEESWVRRWMANTTWHGWSEIVGADSRHRKAAWAVIVTVTLVFMTVTVADLVHNITAPTQPTHKTVGAPNAATKPMQPPDIFICPTHLPKSPTASMNPPESVYRAIAGAIAPFSASDELLLDSGFASLSDSGEVLLDSDELMSDGSEAAEVDRWVKANDFDLTTWFNAAVNEMCAHILRITLNGNENIWQEDACSMNITMQQQNNNSVTWQPHHSHTYGACIRVSMPGLRIRAPGENFGVKFMLKYNETGGYSRGFYHSGTGYAILVGASETHYYAPPAKNAMLSATPVDHSYYRPWLDYTDPPCTIGNPEDEGDDYVTHDQCLLFCEQQVTELACNCTSNQNTAASSSADRSSASASLRQCKISEALKCYKNGTETPSTMEKIDVCRSKCKSKCSYSSHAINRAHLPFPSINGVVNSTNMGIPLVDGRLDTSYIVGLNLYYATFYKTTQHVTQRASIGSTLSNLGGMLGLWMGMSLVTIVHALVYLAFGTYDYVADKMRARKKAKRAVGVLVDGAATANETATPQKAAYTHFVTTPNYGITLEVPDARH